MKFLCDHMLIRLGKWLRAAGYDTRIAVGTASDIELLQLALTEERLLITRDKHFLQFKEGKFLVIYLKSNLLQDCIQELNSHTSINWLYSPFTRCLICNGLLEKASPNAAILEQVPQDIKEDHLTLTYCSNCHKVYWDGSHMQRMLKELQNWQSF